MNAPLPWNLTPSPPMMNMGPSHSVPPVKVTSPLNQLRPATTAPHSRRQRRRHSWASQKGRGPCRTERSAVSQSSKPTYDTVESYRPSAQTSYTSQALTDDCALGADSLCDVGIGRDLVSAPLGHALVTRGGIDRRDEGEEGDQGFEREHDGVMCLVKRVRVIDWCMGDWASEGGWRRAEW
jgi:hypothetical protein